MNSPSFKNIILSIGMVLSVFAMTSCTDHRVKTRFFVQGSCEECKEIIENLLKEQKGVEEAIWNFQTSLTTVVFDTTRTNENQLQQAIAKGGFSTPYFDADTAAWKNLPSCCAQALQRKLLPLDNHPH